MKTQDLAQFATQAAELVTVLDKPAFYKQLEQFIFAHVNCDSVVVILYDEGSAPTILLDRSRVQEQPVMLERYYAGAYLLSPFYLYWQAHRQAAALLRLSDIAPDAFFDNVYYTDYYEGSSFKDELGYVFGLDEQCGLLISLGRMQGSFAFTDAEYLHLQALTDFLAALVKQHFYCSHLFQRETMRTWLEASVQHFGRHELTEREHAVLQLMLRGHSSKSCARELGIAPATERVHRRNIYTKLNISSQAELFRLFFDTLSGLAHCADIGQDATGESL